MLDKTLAKEIRMAAPARVQDRDGYFTFVRKVTSAAKEMGVTTIREDFDALSAKHGRAVTAVVLAATLYERKGDLNNWNIMWAYEVLDCWPHTQGLMERAAIHDGIHLTAICDYAVDFIRCNTEA